MAEKWVPNLEEMDEQEAHRFLTDLYSRHIPDEEFNVRHPEDYVMEMPQSGERFRGRENMLAFQEAHPTPPSSLQVRRVQVKEGLWVVEGVIDYGDGRILDVVVISELRDGKMWRAEEHRVSVCLRYQDDPRHLHQTADGTQDSALTALLEEAIC